MVPYVAPREDINFVLSTLIGFDNLTSLTGFEDFDADTIGAILDEGSKIASEVFAPLNRPGDQQGLRLENGQVIMPPGFSEAYSSFVGGGWNHISVSPELGGTGAPWVVGMAVQEMLSASNMSLALPTLLNQGAIEALSHHGSDALKEKFLPKMVSGEWTSTMNLTESQAGSDVGAVRATAEPEGGHYHIKADKIYISFGGHDMTDNIVHLVLARLPGAPAGTKGLSLFLVPNRLVNDDGSLGALNDIRVERLEHKLGQHAAPTCAMTYGANEGAVGYLIGEEGGGMAAMFTMMNNARIGVGYQGLAAMQGAYQQAFAYAHERKQGPNPAERGSQLAIINYPDVQRMLLDMKSKTEAARAVAYYCAYMNDVSKHHASDVSRAWAKARVDLLTPIVKGWITDLSSDVTHKAVQVFGGAGFITDTGIDQYARDARILPIYEGTNGIQAIDLVGRKLTGASGDAFSQIMDEVRETADEARKRGEGWQEIADYLNEARDCTSETAESLTQTNTDPKHALAGATPFLKLLGDTLGGYMLAKSALIADPETEFGKAKLITANYYATNILPQARGHAVAAQQGAQAIAMPAGMF